MTPYSPRQAVNITFSSLVTKLAIFAISVWKHSGQLLNALFIYSEDITPSPGYLEGWRIYKMTDVALGPKSHSRTLIQGI